MLAQGCSALGWQSIEYGLRMETGISHIPQATDKT